MKDSCSTTRRLLPFTVFLFVLIPNMCTEPNYELTWERVEMKVQVPEYFDPTSYTRIRRHSRGAKTGLFMLLNITKALPDASLIDVVLYEGSDRSWRKSFVDIHESLCKFLKSEVKIFRGASDAIGFPRQCPIGPGVFNMDNYAVDPKDLPPVLPGNQRRKLLIQFRNADSVLFAVDVILGVIRFKPSSKPKS